MAPGSSSIPLAGRLSARMLSAARRWLTLAALTGAVFVGLGAGAGLGFLSTWWPPRGVS